MDTSYTTKELIKTTLIGYAQSRIIDICIDFAYVDTHIVYLRNEYTKKSLASIYIVLANHKISASFAYGDVKAGPSNYDDRFEYKYTELDKALEHMKIWFDTAKPRKL